MSSNFGGNIRPSRPPVADPTKPAVDPTDPNADPNATSGDGFHHHTIDQNESGFHSSHTDPEGQTQEADHGSYDEAKDFEDQMFGEQDGSGDQADDDLSGGDTPTDSSDVPDLSGAYSK
jgi:hypothetical protein